MENLFVYGTLKNPEVLKLIIGRDPDSSPDSLEGYRVGEIEIDGETYNILIPDKQKKPVKGLVLSVTDEELKKLDEYETDIYQRKTAELKSGKKAFVYLANPL